MGSCDVLIVGAGPSGLVLALWLVRLGIRVRIIDHAAEPGTTSRAIAVQARTLEFYRQVGLDQAIVAAGLRFAGGNLWVAGRPVGHIPFGSIGAGQSPFPYILSYPQDEHESLLIGELAKAGVLVERPVELLDFADDPHAVTARLRKVDGDGNESFCVASYLAGCDGAHSTVRQAVSSTFPGGTYNHLFYVADIEGVGALMNGELQIALDDADFLALFPLRGPGHGRLIGAVRSDALTAEAGASAPGDQALSWSDVSRRSLQRLPIDITRVNWFSAYRVHHRVAAKFRAGRAFLVGDAAHIHSPVGGQGMNTGIGDAVNLAWKLAQVVRGGDPGLLDSYEPERQAFARRLVATTDRAFTFVTNDGGLARQVRTKVVPRLLPRLFSSDRLRRLMFRTVSQTAINYRHSALSRGRAGPIHGGDRLPWVAPQPGGTGSDNFVPLAALVWQVHLYGETPAAASVRASCARLRLPLHVFPHDVATEQAGLRPDVLYLVRPDGYVALVTPASDTDTLERYHDQWIRVDRGRTDLRSGLHS